MKGYRINAGELAHRHWLHASVFSEDGSHKLELLETAIGFTVTVKPLATPKLTEQHRYPLAAALERNNAPPGVYSATHDLLLTARKQSYLAAATFFQEKVAMHGVRYPSPTRGELCGSKWQAQLKPKLRGSPFLALALTDYQAGELWVTIQDGELWQARSAVLPSGAAQLAHRLRSYGRLTLQLAQEDGRLTVARLDPQGSAYSKLEDIPLNLRKGLSFITLH